MKVNKPVGRKDHSDPLVAYVVIGDGPRAGEIKTVRYNYNMWADHLLTVERRKQDRVITFIESVNVRGNLADRGWFILDDEYDRLERERGDGYWARAKQAWYEYQEACERGQVVNPSFPDKLFPPVVLELRKSAEGAARRRESWDPSNFVDLLEGPQDNAEEAPKPKRGRPKKSASPEHGQPESDKFPEAEDLPLPGGA